MGLFSASVLYIGSKQSRQQKILPAQILAAPDETLAFPKASLAGNPGRGFEESFRIEHDEAFRKILLKIAGEGFKRKKPQESSDPR